MSHTLLTAIDHFGSALICACRFYRANPSVLVITLLLSVATAFLLVSGLVFLALYPAVPAR